MDDDIIDINWDDLVPAKPPGGGGSLTVPLAPQPPGPNRQQQIEQQFGVQFPPPGRGEQYFFGVARQPNVRQEQENHWPTIFSTQPISRSWQILTFTVEIRDAANNVVELVGVEVRALSISGIAPSDGTPVAVCGKRGNDGVIHTWKVYNLHTRSSLSVSLPRGWKR